MEEVVAVGAAQQRGTGSRNSATMARKIAWRFHQRRVHWLRLHHAPGVKHSPERQAVPQTDGERRTRGRLFLVLW